MESPEITVAARNFTVMVRISGPGLKFRRSAFHLYESEKTKLPASELLLPDSLIGLPVGDFVGGMGYKGPEISGLVVTAGSLVEPFLPWNVRAGGVGSGELVGLINAAQIDVLSEFGANEVGDGKHGRPNWMPVDLVALFNIPYASDAVRSLIEVHLGLKEHSLWEAGWNLDVNNNSDVPNKTPQERILL